jgi:hypothetical protein
VFCRIHLFVLPLWFHSFLFSYPVKQALFYFRKFKKKLKIFVDLFMSPLHFFSGCFVLNISLHIWFMNFYYKMQLRYTIHFFSSFLKIKIKICMYCFKFILLVYSLTLEVRKPYVFFVT